MNRSNSIDSPVSCGWAEALLLLLRRALHHNDPTVVRESAGDEAAEAKIRCPLCRWQPDRTSLWTCWDCEFPEYFFDGCGTEWNTFDSKGVCPTCSHQWMWTSCLSCWGWSKHEDWYKKSR